MVAQSRKAATTESSLREQLARKRARQVRVPIPVTDDAERLSGELRDADRNLQLAKALSRKDPSQVDIPRLQNELDKAREAYEAECLVLTFRGLSPDERDALHNEHAEESDDGELKLGKGYRVAAIAASVVDSDMTEDEWRDELASGRWSVGETEALFNAAVSATNEEPGGSLPKG